MFILILLIGLWRRYFLIIEVYVNHYLDALYTMPFCLCLFTLQGAQFSIPFIILFHRDLADVIILLFFVASPSPYATIFGVFEATTKQELD